MDSKYHALISAGVGSVVAVVTGGSLLEGLFVVGYATALGTLIDLDHFLLARYRTGRWRALRDCVRDPRLVLFDRDAIFRVGEVGRLHRLLSHLIIAGLLVGVLAFVDSLLAGLTAAVLYAHLLADLVDDVRTVGDSLS